MDFDFDPAVDDAVTDDKYIMPPKIRPKKIVHWTHAEKLAKEIKLTKDSNYFIIVSGKFVLGDLYGYLLKENDLVAERMDISTLSYNRYNLLAFEQMIKKGHVKKLNLITSQYFFRHYRASLIQETYETLDKYDFQLAVTRSHCKVATIKTECGLHIVMHGSANCRSAACDEQIQITEDKSLYDFYTEYNDSIINNHKTIRR